MANAFNSYLRGKQSAMQEGQNMLAMDLAIRKQDDARAKTLLGSNNPKDWQTAMLYMKGTPEQRKAFDTTKRQQQILNLGGTQKNLGTGESFDVTLKPSENVDYIADKAAKTKKAQIKADAQAKAITGLPQAQMQFEQSSSMVDSILKHPGLDSSFGKLGIIPAIPGSEKANFRSQLEQLQNTVFIVNREALKGGGAITDFEGTKAENAALRANKAQSAKEFRAAMKDYQKWVDRGFNNLKKAAKGDFTGQPTNDINKQALKWANENPQDPRAMQIMQKLGSQ